MTIDRRGRRYPPLPERFWAKVDVRGPDECWEWQAYREKLAGYGVFRVNDTTMLAHRVSYCLANNVAFSDLLPERVVMHSCDNPPCVNPAHLSAGSQLENVADCKRKGRNYNYDGDIRPCKLSNVNALRLLSMRVNQKYSISELAKIFGIGKTTVRRVLDGERKVYSYPRVTRDRGRRGRGGGEQ